MRLRVLLTNGSRTVDLIWLEHNGTDIYYGYVGWPEKTSYHASGQRHSRSASGERTPIQAHHRLDQFSAQLQLCAFGFDKEIVRSSLATEYTGKRGDSVIFLDSRSLPQLVNVSLGLVEVGGYNAMLPVHIVSDLRFVHLVTSTVPWIYVMVGGTCNVA